MITAFFAPTPQPSRLTTPVYASTVPADFSSPADDYLESRLDLNDLLVRDPAATFMVCVCGDSISGEGRSSSHGAVRQYGYSYSSRFKASRSKGDPTAVQCNGRTNGGRAERDQLSFTRGCFSG